MDLTQKRYLHIYQGYQFLTHSEFHIQSWGIQASSHTN